MTTNKHTSVWLIIPQTNLHVGNESVVNFTVIDKAIQRDVTTGIPCINSSSLKGAIKEFMTHKQCDKIKEIFGSTKKDKNDSQKGNAVFFDATLLAIPEQITGGSRCYRLVHNKEIVDSFIAKTTALGIENITYENIKSEIGVEVGKRFNELCEDDNLPIIARNCLENGESTNLWYEQVLPSQSVLATIIEGPEELEKALDEEKIVQIGANATIGYGYCKFIKL